MTLNLCVTSELHDDWLLMNDSPRIGKDASLVAATTPDGHAVILMLDGPTGHLHIWEASEQSASGWKVTELDLSVVLPGQGGPGTIALQAFMSHEVLHCLVRGRRLLARQGPGQWVGADLPSSMTTDGRNVRVVTWTDHASGRPRALLAGGPSSPSAPTDGVVKTWIAELHHALAAESGGDDLWRTLMEIDHRFWSPSPVPWLDPRLYAIDGGRRFRMIGQTVFDGPHLTTLLEWNPDGTLRWVDETRHQWLKRDDHDLHDWLRDLQGLEGRDAFIGRGNVGSTFIVDFDDARGTHTVEHVTARGATEAQTQFLFHRAWAVCQINPPTGPEEEVHGHHHAVSVVDQQGTLWLRRLNVQPGGAIDYDSWVQLGYDFACAALRQVPHGVDLFAIDIEGGLHRLQHDAPDAQWVHTTLKAPVHHDSTPVRTPVHAAEVRVRDAAGNPLALQDLQLLVVEEPVLAMLPGRRVNMVPGQPVTVRTNAAGEFRLSVIADGIAAPTFQVRLNDEAPPSELTLDEQVRRKLAGQDARFAMNGQALQAAGVLSPSMSRGDADEIAAALRAMVGASVASTDPAPAAASWQLRPGGASSGATLVSRRSTAGIAFQKVEGWLEGLAADVLRAIRHPKTTVQLLHVTVHGGLVKLRMWADRSMTEVKEFVVSGARAIGHAIKSFIDVLHKWGAATAQAAHKLVEFVKDVYDWDAIIATHDQIKTLIRCSLKALGDECRRPRVSRLMTNLVNRASTAPSVAVESTLGSGRSPAAIPVAENRSPRSRLLTSALSEHGHRMKPKDSPGQTRTVATGEPPSGASVQHMAGLSARLASFDEAHGSSLASALVTLLSGNLRELKPHQLQERLLPTFLAAKDQIGEMLALVAQGAGNVIDHFVQMLELEIHVPVVSALYAEITKGRSLTLLDLASLLLAIPLSVGMRLASHLTGLAALGDAAGFLRSTFALPSMPADGPASAAPPLAALVHAFDQACRHFAPEEHPGQPAEAHTVAFAAASEGAPWPDTPEGRNFILGIVSSALFALYFEVDEILNALDVALNEAQGELETATGATRQSLEALISNTTWVKFALTLSRAIVAGLIQVMAIPTLSNPSVGHDGWVYANFVLWWGPAFIDVYSAARTFHEGSYADIASCMWLLPLCGTAIGALATLPPPSCASYRSKLFADLANVAACVAVAASAPRLLAQRPGANKAAAVKAAMTMSLGNMLAAALIGASTATTPGAPTFRGTTAS